MKTAAEHNQKSKKRSVQRSPRDADSLSDQPGAFRVLGQDSDAPSDLVSQFSPSIHAENTQDDPHVPPETLLVTAHLVDEEHELERERERQQGRIEAAQEAARQAAQTAADSAVRNFLRSFGVVEAEPMLLDEDLEEEFEEAKDMHVPNDKWFKNHRSCWFVSGCCLAVVLLVVTIIPVVIVLSKRKGNSGQSSSQKDIGPTPTTEPTVAVTGEEGCLDLNITLSPSLNPTTVSSPGPPTPTPKTAEETASPTVTSGTSAPLYVTTTSPLRDPTNPPSTTIPSSPSTYLRTASPSRVQTDIPTSEFEASEKTNLPTESPTYRPTDPPGDPPTDPPTISPTKSPTYLPTNSPTGSPTSRPTDLQTNPLTKSPTSIPAISPTGLPTIPPSNPPTLAPSLTPTAAQTVAPTVLPTVAPTEDEVVRFQTREELLEAVDDYLDRLGKSSDPAFMQQTEPMSTEKWIVSDVTNFTAMFSFLRNRNAALFNHPDISSWDVSGATSLFEMFTGAETFNQDISRQVLLHFFLCTH